MGNQKAGAVSGGWLVLFLMVLLLHACAVASAAPITVNGTELWDGGTMHGIVPSGIGTEGDPYVYVIPEGIVVTATGVIDNNDKYVTFDFGSGAGGLDLDAGGYFDLTGNDRKSLGGCTIVLGDNNLTGGGDFKTVDIYMRPLSLTITGAGSVEINSIYMRRADAKLGTVDIDVGGRVSIDSIDTQDQDASGNEGADVTIRGGSLMVGDIDTRSFRDTKSSGNVLLQARGYYGDNTLDNTANLYGTINTDAPLDLDGNITIRGVVVTLESGFDVIKGSGSLGIYAGIIQYGKTAGDLFINDSGGSYSATHSVPWQLVAFPKVSFELSESAGFETVSPALIEVSLTQAYWLPVTVSYVLFGGSAQGGIDYDIPPGSILFDPCETSKTISIDIIDDGVHENDETIVVFLDSTSDSNIVLGDITQHTYTIIDPRPHLGFDTSGSSDVEDASQIRVGASLSWASDQIITVQYNVTGGTATGGGVDYNLPAGTLTFNPGDLTRYINLDIVADEVLEDDETIELALSNPSANVRLDGGTEHAFTIIENRFLSFADSRSVALWLFDETDYPHATLTDASVYEYDLCLMDEGHLVAGKFGNALEISGASFTSAYAGFKGVAVHDEMREADGIPSGLWGPTVAPEKILTTFADSNWTCEFWLKLSATPSSEVMILDLGHAYNPGASFWLAGGAGAFDVESHYGGFEANCPTNSSALTDTNWHHVAFSYDANTSELLHYLDGQVQATPTVNSIPVEPTPEVNWPSSLDHDTFGFMASSPAGWRRQHRFNITIGHDRAGDMAMSGMVDEVRLSDKIRYEGNFAPPGSFSRNYAGAPSVPSAAELLFPGGSATEPVQIGSRKHVFIDEVLVDTKSDINLTVNPPSNPQNLNEYLYRDVCVFDKNNQVHMVVGNGYSSPHGNIKLYVSDDGVNFSAPDLKIVEYLGSTSNNIMLGRAPMWSTAFVDGNPNIGSEELFKMTGWVANRGIYLYFSPDGIHWRRNETCLLPLVSGGNAETFWDDQRGRYATFLKRDSSFHNEGCPGHGRRSVMFDTNEVEKTWPFIARDNPYFEGWPFPSVTCEGPVVFGVSAYGEVYRSRAEKYRWAPDVYLAFLWRYNEATNARQTELAVSRDGDNWQTYADLGFYISAGFDYYGWPIVEAMAHTGLIRRGDEIWQYAEYGGGPHGGWPRFPIRLTQRLDGFTSLDAEATTGTFTTLPMVFCGDRLVLNISASGTAKVAMLDQSGTPISGFDLTDCDPISDDSVRLLVTWNGSSDVSALTGTTIRLRFEMQNAKLYAFQFHLLGDIYSDCAIDYLDLKVLADNWLWSGTPRGNAADIYPDGTVDFADFAILAECFDSSGCPTEYGEQDLANLIEVIGHYPNCYVGPADANFNVCFDLSSWQAGVPDGWLGPEDVAYMISIINNGP